MVHGMNGSYMVRTVHGMNGSYMVRTVHGMNGSYMVRMVHGTNGSYMVRMVHGTYAPNNCNSTKSSFTDISLTNQLADSQLAHKSTE